MYRRTFTTLGGISTAANHGTITREEAAQLRYALGRDFAVRVMLCRDSNGSGVITNPSTVTADCTAEDDQLLETQRRVAELEATVADLNDKLAQMLVTVGGLSSTVRTMQEDIKPDEQTADADKLDAIHAALHKWDKGEGSASAFIARVRIILAGK